MSKERRLVLIGLLVLGGAIFVVSEATARPDTTGVPFDSSRIAARHASDTLLARFRSDPAFDYDRQGGVTWWQDLRRWVGAQLSRLFGRSVSGGWPLQLLVYLGLAAVVGYAAYMLVRLRSDARSPSRMNPESVVHPNTVQELRTIDFAARVETAVAHNEFRRGVRLLYQWTLQRLDTCGAITWQPGKTNREYVRELESEGQSTFADLTRRFERVWYGGVDVGPDHFAEIRHRFDAFWERVRDARGGPETGAALAGDDARSHPENSDRSLE